MAVLYRKYRPKVFSEVVGQGPITQTLINALKSKKVAHAYLFTGSRGVGKTTVARVLARALNCQKPKDGEACLSCTVCEAFDRGTFLDMVEIDAASNTGVDNIRELIEHVRFQPSLGAYKVFIIDETHMLSKAAFNALLKTLEEPPEHAIFILATTELNKVPATIVSRTQRFDFKRLPETLLQAHLESIVKKEKLPISGDVVRLVVHAAGGSVRDALSLLGKVASLGDVSVQEAQTLLGITDIEYARRLLEAVLSGNVSDVSSFFESALEDGLDIAVFNKDFLEYLRAVLLAKVGSSEDSIRLAGAEDPKTVFAFAGKLSLPDIMHIIRIFLKALKDLQGGQHDELPMLLAGLEAALKFQRSIPQASNTTVEQIIKPTETITADPVKSEAEMPKPRPKQGVVPSISLEELSVSWPAICDYLKTVNGPLATLVKNSPLRRVEDGVIVLGVKFVFHKEHIESAKNQTIISDAVQSVTGHAFGIRAELVEKEPAPGPGESGAVGDALAIFGGELVE